MEDAAHNQMVSLIWNIADDVLRDVFLRGQYRDVILPMIVLRRLDALLEPTKAEVDAEVKENGIDPDVLVDITRLPYYSAGLHGPDGGRLRVADEADRSGSFGEDSAPRQHDAGVGVCQVPVWPRAGDGLHEPDGKD